MLRGIWEGGTRKQNGHWQSGDNGGGDLQVVDLHSLLGNYNQDIYGMTDDVTGDYFYLPLGLKPKNAPVIKSQFNLNGASVTEYKVTDYIPDTGVYTYVDNTRCQRMPVDAHLWFRYLYTSGSQININLGNANEQSYNPTQMNASAIVKDWLLPSYSLFKISNPGSTTFRDILTYANANTIVIPKGKSFVRDYPSYNGGTIDEVGHDSEITDGTFRISYDNVAPNTANRPYDGNICFGWGLVLNFFPSPGRSTSPVPNCDTAYGYLDNVGGILWVMILKKLRIESLPMTS